MSISLNSFFFPKGECVGTLILISEGVRGAYNKWNGPKMARNMHLPLRLPQAKFSSSFHCQYSSPTQQHW